MKPYEWMVTCTPQTQWIEKKGVLLWLAFFFIELGAGAYLFASFFNRVEAMIMGWLICGALGGGLHLLYLGKPLRFYRMFLRPQSSWISRGMIFVNLFLSLGFFAILLHLAGAPAVWLVVLSDIFAFLVVIYGGFAMCCINGIPLWNTAILPILYVISGLWGGAGLTLVVAMQQGLAQTSTTIEGWAHMFLISFSLLLGTYLLTVNFGSTAAKRAIREILKGSGSPLFWIIVILVGIVAPLLTMLLGLEIPFALFCLIFVGELLGDLGMRYLILKYGFYNPLIPSGT